MAGQKFEFDESGNTFLPFALSFLGLVLLICTYYFWPTPKKEKRNEDKNCRCEPCLVKKGILEKNEPAQKIKRYIIRLFITIGWILFAYVAYKVTQTDQEIVSFNPHEILGIDQAASTSEIKKAYHKLSLLYHPDKPTGDEKLFMNIAKAYQALTDETAKKNWELYGNPDGPRAMSFGIALPSWIVEKENSIWVLGLYALVFMVALPTTVGIWWYRSIQYSGDKVLLDTTQLYYYFFHKSPQMQLKRAIMVLAASYEFEKGHNSEIPDRINEIEDIRKLIKLLPHLNEKKKERPLCFGYSILARALLHAHLSRLPLPPDTLELDRQLVVRKCPALIQEMVSCVSQLIMMAHTGRIQRSKMPTLQTIESVITMSQMVVQALWYVKKHPLFQLPHVTEDMQRYFKLKKRPIKTIRQFCEIDEEDRRSIFRNLTDDQYSDLMSVCSSMPLIEFQVHCQVLDDDEPEVITAGSMVTVAVSLTRKDMGSLLHGETQYTANSLGEEHSSNDEEEDEEKPLVEEEDTSQAPLKAKKPVWQKQKKGGKKSGTGNKKQQQKQQKKVTLSAIKNSPEFSKPDSEDGERKKTELDNDDNQETDESSNSDTENNPKQIDEESSPEVDEQEWEKCQTELSKNKRKVLEGNSLISHPVHCPYFPDEKQEYWWIYVCDEKKKCLISAPYLVTNLRTSENCSLQFSAPSIPGKYQYTVFLRSDSYLGFDQFLKINLDVKQAKVIKEHPQWDISEEEEEEEDESDLASDEDVEDEDLKDE